MMKTKFLVMLLALVFLMVTAPAFAEVYWVDQQVNQPVQGNAIVGNSPYGFGNSPMYFRPNYSSPTTYIPGFSYPMYGNALWRPYQYPNNLPYQQNFNPNTYTPTRHRGRAIYVPDSNYYYPYSYSYPYYQPEGVTYFYPYSNYVSRSTPEGNYYTYTGYYDSYYNNYYNEPMVNQAPKPSFNQSWSYSTPAPSWYQPYVYGNPMTADQMMALQGQMYPSQKQEAVQGDQVKKTEEQPKQTEPEKVKTENPQNSEVPQGTDG